MKYAVFTTRANRPAGVIATCVNQADETTPRSGTLAAIDLPLSIFVEPSCNTRIPAGSVEHDISAGCMGAYRRDLLQRYTDHARCDAACVAHVKAHQPLWPVPALCCTWESPVHHDVHCAANGGALQRIELPRIFWLSDNVFQLSLDICNERLM